VLKRELSCLKETVGSSVLVDLSSILNSFEPYVSQQAIEECLPKDEENLLQVHWQ